MPFFCAALAAAGHRALPDDLAVRLADRFTAYREEEMFVFPGAHEAIDQFKALGIKLAPYFDALVELLTTRDYHPLVRFSALVASNSRAC